MSNSLTPGITEFCRGKGGGMSTHARVGQLLLAHFAQPSFPRLCSSPPSLFLFSFCFPQVSEVREEGNGAQKEQMLVEPLPQWQTLKQAFCNIISCHLYIIPEKVGSLFPFYRLGIRGSELRSLHMDMQTIRYRLKGLCASSLTSVLQGSALSWSSRCTLNLPLKQRASHRDSWARIHSRALKLRGIER